MVGEVVVLSECCKIVHSKVSAGKSLEDLTMCGKKKGLRGCWRVATTSNKPVRMIAKKIRFGVNMIAGAYQGCKV